MDRPATPRGVTGRGASAAETPESSLPLRRCVVPGGVLAQTRLTPVHRIFTTSVASVYPHYVAKVEKKGRTRAELDGVICWLTGYDDAALRRHLDEGTTFEDFFAQASLNPHAALITGTVCGVRVEDVEDPLMQRIRYLDKLVDELAKGRPMEKVLRA